MNKIDAAKQQQVQPRIEDIKKEYAKQVSGIEKRVDDISMIPARYRGRGSKRNTPSKLKLMTKYEYAERTNKIVKERHKTVTERKETDKPSQSWTDWLVSFVTK